MTATDSRRLDPRALRQVVRQQCGYDPGPLDPHTALDAVGISGLSRLQVVWWLESTLDVELPADLITAVETVDDLCHYAAVKVDQRRSPARAPGGAP